MAPKKKKGKKGKSDEPVEEETDWDRMDIEMLKVRLFIIVVDYFALLMVSGRGGFRYLYDLCSSNTYWRMLYL